VLRAHKLKTAVGYDLKGKILVVNVAAISAFISCARGWRQRPAGVDRLRKDKPKGDLAR
jgi:hypothetical protein